MTPKESVRHLDSIITISVTAELERVVDQPDWEWAEGDRMREHYHGEAAKRAYALGMELAPGPAERWEVSGEVLFSYPLMPYGSALPRYVLTHKLPKWGEEYISSWKYWGVMAG
jgi:hypothetical protein